MSEFGMEEEIKKSKFNEAGLKMTRVHKLQDTINICSLNKLGHFIDVNNIGVLPEGERNYKVIFQCLNQLLMEVWGKLEDNDRKSVSQKRNVINEFLKTKNPYQLIYDLNNRSYEELNVGNWVILEEQLIEYEEDIRNLLDKHKISGGNQDDEDGDGL